MIRLIRSHFQILFFCFLTVFFTGLGQTFLVAQFLPEIQAGLDMGRSKISLIYSIATFMASLNLSYLGKLLDRVNLTFFAWATIIMIMAGLGLLSFSVGVVTLFLGFYVLRGFGQMTLGLIAITTVSKLFGRHRGKALTMVNLGRSLGEGIWPSLVVFLIATFGWRDSFLLLAVGIGLVLLPLSSYFLPRFPKGALYDESKKARENREADLTSWSWLEVIKRKKPFIIMILNAILPFVLTGLFFQQSSIAEFKNWSMTLMASSFTAFSLLHIVGNVICGHLTDLYSAKNLQPFILIPVTIGSIFLFYFDAKWASFVYMGFAGLSVGLSSTTKSAFWAEVYGTENLGRVRGMDSLMMVVGTSLAPTLYAFILDNLTDVSGLIVFLIATCLVGTLGYIIIGRLKFDPAPLVEE